MYLKFKIHFEKEGQKDWFIIRSKTIEEVIDKAKKELIKRGVNPNDPECYSEQIFVNE